MPSEADYPPSTHQSSSLWLRLLALAMLLGAFALRLYQLGGESLWYDETVSAYLAFQSPADLVTHTARDIHPPAYYLLLYAWQRLTAPTPAFGLEFLFAWPSLWLGTLSLALTFALAKRWTGNTGALTALSVAALQPMQIWYAQEVRMYALGALCLLVTLWAVTPWLLDTEPTHKSDPPKDVSHGPSSRQLAAYIIAAALGLYTLYYFLFWLLVLNACLIFRIWTHHPARRRWLIAQFLVLILWLPWLPTFIRQALVPPVPAWRVPWQLPADLVHGLLEGLSAQLTAHTQPLDTLWPWAVMVLVFYIVSFAYAKSQRATLLVVMSLTPLLLLLVISSVGLPIYHVRYLATYAPIFPLVIATFAAHARPHRVGVTSLALLLISVIASASLVSLWTDPRYAADDHRQAVTDLAHNWRPGDAIVVNAGWVYTAIAVYWPRDLAAPNAALPPALRAFPRLTEVPFTDHTSQDHLNFGPVVYRTGSINGPATLGWGHANSDFFSISSLETQQALARIDDHYHRLWHYRLYDTVSDPQGELRAWLAEQKIQDWDRVYSGPGFLRIERYPLRGPADPTPTGAPLLQFEYGFDLQSAAYVTPHSAGSLFYVDLYWRATPSQASPPLAISLRLYDHAGKRIAQADEPLPPSSANGSVRQPLALPIPAATQPGDYTLALIVYDPATLAPITLRTPAPPTVDTAFALGTVRLTPPASQPLP